MDRSEKNTSSGNKSSNHAGLWKRLVSFGFRLLYHEMAWSYDLVAWLVSFGQWREWGQTALPYLTGERVLELGHGPGHLLVDMAQQGLCPVGLEPSPSMMRLAQRRLGRASLTLPLARGHAQALPFPAHAFDSIVATFPTRYIVEPETLAEVARVLRPGGRLIVVVGARLSGRDPRSRFVEWLYSVSGQRQGVDNAAWEAPFVTAGLAVRRVQVEMRRSHVLLLIAERAAL